MMHNNLIRLSLLLGIVLSFLSGCQREDADISLDNQLLDALVKASGGKSRDYYRFPASDDFTQIPQDPKNPLTRDKVTLGKLLFHDPCIGSHPKDSKGLMTYSCSSCHHAKAGFQANMAQGIGEGGLGFGLRGEGRFPDPAYVKDSIDVQPIRTPSALNIAFQTNILWNGQFGATGVNTGTDYAWTPGTPKEVNNLGFEGVETQAIAGQKVHRLNIDTVFLNAVEAYKYLFNKAFSNLSPTKRITKQTAGLAIAAYERTLFASESPFQKWLAGNRYAMSNQQKLGAVLFFGKANCYKCHNGPALNSMAFYALGMNDLQDGHYGAVNADPNKAEHKGRGGFTGKSEDMFKFKVPQLYNLKDSKFYGHGASFTSIWEVLQYKNNGIPQNSKVPKSQLAPEFSQLHLTTDELKALEDFILNGLHDPNLNRYVPTVLPSKLCFPNNDIQSKIDMDCL